MPRSRGIAIFFSGVAVGALGVALLFQRFGGGERAYADRAPQPAEVSQPTDDDPLAIGLPIAGLRAKDILDTFAQKRGGDRAHEAADIMAPRGTPVLAVHDGTIRKLFCSQAGGLTVYEFDSTETYCYYYAHLDRYPEELREGQVVRRGDVIGYVGSTGNARPGAPHLHFAIVRLDSNKNWWGGTPINPYPLLTRALGRE